MSEDKTGRNVVLQVDGAPMHCVSGQSVASALLANHVYSFQRSPNRDLPRGAFCMMGACQECVVVIDGVVRRACQTEVKDGLSVSLMVEATL